MSDAAEPSKRKNRWDIGDAGNGSLEYGTENGDMLPPTAETAAMSTSVQAAKELAKEALAKAQRAAEMQKVIQQQMSSLVGLPAGAELRMGAPKPPTVTLDSQGRLLDERGKVIQSTAKPQATIKVNQSARSNPLLEAAAPPDPTNNKYFDPRMALPGQAREQRRKRAFNFVSEGHFSKRADELRAKAAVEDILREARAKQPVKKAATITLGGKEASEQSTQKPLVSSATLKQKLKEVPAAEWWDLPLLRSTAYAGPPGDSLDANMTLEAITHYVEHPIPIEPPAEPPPPPPQPLPLTKRERKKLRTQRRLAAEKEKQDQIRCGLMAPPPPKVKISNLMQAQKDQAVADPSKLEAEVRAQIAQRMKNHEMRNQARKLTPQQRKEKKRRKMLNDPTGGGTPVTLYRIDQMPSRQKLYKLDINAQQNHLTGIALLTDACNLVVVEGGPKAQRRYRKLLMHRIDWTDLPADDDDDEEDEDDAEERRRQSSQVCKVVWEGFVVKPHFKNFRVEGARTPDTARKLLKERGCEHYWDMASRYDVDAAPDEEEIDDDEEDEDEDEDEGEGEGDEDEGDEENDDEDSAEGAAEAGDCEQMDIEESVPDE
mmetsp:Transcript_9767/g.16202  ORF Transcript_9767/g.16202 Transcript_9767/m.16202 type:complete len:601 (+) Transcript_9767:109-1911(+)